MSVREHITRKVLLCLDEAMPSLEKTNGSFFPVDQVLDEAARWVLKTAPLHAIGPGKELPKDGLVPRKDGTGELPLPTDFIRLIRFRMKGWARPVQVPILTTDARYIQQFNPTIRGGEAKPVVALCEELGKLEYFSSSRGIGAEIAEARYFGFTDLNDDFPEKLIDVAAWKAAELVSSIMNDALAMQICAGKVAENIQIL